MLLDSARPHPVTGRYTFLSCDPALVLRAHGRQVMLGPPGQLTVREASPLVLLRKLLAAPPTISIEGMPPCVGGAVGLFGYDLARTFERLPARASDDLHLPDLLVGIYETMVAIDHATDDAWVITRALPSLEPVRAYDAAVERLEAWTDRLIADGPPVEVAIAGAEPHEICAEVSQTEFVGWVRQAKRWIAAGDIYQANLSQRLQAPLTTSPWAMYRRLRAVNPSPFAAYVDAGDLQVVSASPERLVKVSGDVVETRPIAGTRPRTGEAARDRKQLAELLADPKERAEHLMLVDLERNDLGRVCAYGSVEVSEFMATEAYSHVFHIVSNIRGRLRPGLDWLDVAAAVFPGGTITGCPKIRSLEIIDALEPVRRQFYTGSIGYISFTGAMDWNLVIRSALVTGGRVYVQAGAGIVADSDPVREYEETLHKAEALLVTLRGAAVARGGDTTRLVGAAAVPQPQGVPDAVPVG